MIMEAKVLNLEKYSIYAYRVAKMMMSMALILKRCNSNILRDNCFNEITLLMTNSFFT